MDPVLRWLDRWWTLLKAGTPLPARPEPLLVDAYLRLGGLPGRGPTLDSRLELLVSQLSAELSGCRWCVEAGRHRWRKALLPLQTLGALRAPSPECGFSDRERAALAFAAAVAEGTETDGLVSGAVLTAARRHFSEGEIVRLTVLAAGEHLGDRLTARLATRPGPPYLIGVRGLA